MKASILKLSISALFLLGTANALASDNSWYVTANGLKC